MRSFHLQMLRSRLWGLSLMVFLCAGSRALGQDQHDTVDALQQAAPKVYIDCSLCDLNYIKTEIPYVNYVRDRKQANVHVIITSMYTGSGGTEYTMTLFGRLRFEGVDDTLHYNANKTDTQDMTRKGIVNVLKRGFIRYLSHTPLSEYLSISYNKPTAASRVVDAWDYWVFNINLNSFLNGESQYSSNQFWGGVTASRVTEEWKFRFSINLSYNENKYDVTIDENESLTSLSVSRSQWFNGFVARSITDHWSAGIFTYVNSATYGNIALSVLAQPGIEYNLFPYSESTHHQLRIGYQVGLTAKRYIDTTIYFKKNEVLYVHSLSVSLSMQEQWGSSSVTLSGSQYLHELSKNSLSLSGTMSFRIFEGLSLNVTGGYSAVHDQIALAKSQLTPEEIYQQRRELAKNYSYWGSFGLSYSFGSIFNNIVNARFGNQGSGGTTIIYSD